MHRAFKCIFTDIRYLFGSTGQDDSISECDNYIGESSFAYAFQSINTISYIQSCIMHGVDNGMLGSGIDDGVFQAIAEHGCQMS